jgi:hypothetical protein
VEELKGKLKNSLVISEDLGKQSNERMDAVSQQLGEEKVCKRVCVCEPVPSSRKSGMQ